MSTEPNADVRITGRDITVRGDGSHVRLADVSIDVRAGRVHALIGPNGSGKSTLLAVLAGDVRPDIGAVAADGRDWASFKAGEAARFRALLAQETPLSFPFTVREVVAWGRQPWRGSGEDDEAVIADVIALQRLGDLVDRPVPALSGGERARVHLARVLAQRARVLLLDEADAALDLEGQAHLDDAIRQRREAGDAIVIVSHDLSRISSIADDVTLLAHGQVVAQGPTQEAMTADQLTRAYGVRVVEESSSGRRHFWSEGPRPTGQP